eukprot:jgi/Hompol1/2200/HPOL_005886-RA
MLFAAAATALLASGASAFTITTYSDAACAKQVATMNFGAGVCLPSSIICFMGGFNATDPLCAGGQALLGIKAVKLIEANNSVAVNLFGCETCDASCLVQVPLNPTNAPIPCNVCTSDVGDIHNTPKEYIKAVCDSSAGGSTATPSNVVPVTTSSSAAPTTTGNTTTGAPSKGSASGLAVSASAVLAAMVVSIASLAL